MSGKINDSDLDDGVQAWTKSSAKCGLFGRNDSTAQASAPAGSGVFGLTVAPGGVGVFGANNSPGLGRGVQGNGPEAGVGGYSEKGVGVLAQSKLGVGISAQGGQLAAKFLGDVEVTGDIRMVNADCAEAFDIAGVEPVEPGTVMVFHEGGLRPCADGYDRKAAGVVSGAGDFRPALLLDQRPSDRLRQPVALLGKVYCKVDASYGPIEVGDLLTTSPTVGMAMRAADRERAVGALIGKALAPLAGGQGLLPILVVMQ